MKTIAICGHDNAGKTKLAEMLAEHFGYTLIKFPNYSIKSGKQIQAMINRLEPFDKYTFQKLQNENKEITLARLPEGTYIFDRYKLSEIVYGLANGLTRTEVMELADKLPDPDITFILVGKSYGLDYDIYGNEKYQERIKELYKEEGKNTGGIVEYFSNTEPIECVFSRMVKKLERCSL